MAVYNKSWILQRRLGGGLDTLTQAEHAQSEHLWLALENRNRSSSDLRRVVFCFKCRNHRKAWWACDKGTSESTEFVLFLLFLPLKGEAGSILCGQRPLEGFITRLPGHPPLKFFIALNWQYSWIGLKRVAIVILQRHKCRVSRCVLPHLGLRNISESGIDEASLQIHICLAFLLGFLGKTLI